MATLIRNQSAGSHRMTAGEKRVAQCLKRLLEDDYLCWYDVPVGRLRRQPDFIVLHPARGLLFLEVKDWKRTSLQAIDKDSVTRVTGRGLERVANPLKQARQCALACIESLALDPQLRQAHPEHQGKLCMPWGVGAVLTKISRAELQAFYHDDPALEGALPAHLCLTADDLDPDQDPETFQQKLWDMLPYRFANKLSLPQLDRVRAHLFPELRLTPEPLPLFAEAPELSRILDLQQEQLARSLGSGHRVVHGVAGSGKTLILGFRSQFLASEAEKPVLVLCFNQTLARALRAHLRARGVDHNVHVHHFHEWCKRQLRAFHADLLGGDAPLYERQVASVTRAVERGQIPPAQYSAVLIDEGHDFEADWLKLVVQMIDPVTNTLLLLYDDAQAIYRRGRGLDFTLSSVGIQARGRTTILRINYRNTQQILRFALAFAREYLEPKSADDDHVPLVAPDSGGGHGAEPLFKRLPSLSAEKTFMLKCVSAWRERGVALNQIAVIAPDNKSAQASAEALAALGLPAALKDSFDGLSQRIACLTRHSSKGLEFSHVVVVGLGQISTQAEHRADEARLLYVAMTRAREALVVTSHKRNCYTERLENLCGSC